MQTLEELIRNKEIEFHSFGNKLDTDAKKFGNYNWGLVNHVVNQSGKYIVISGSGLEGYLQDVRNLYHFADFVVQIWQGSTREYSEGASIHVDVDIERLSESYDQPKEEKIVNGLGRIMGDAASWVPEILYFEKLWNFALCHGVGGMIGYPGYEHPLSDEQFREEMVNHAENYLVGTKEQLERYKKMASKSVDTTIEIVNQMKKNPNLVFDNPLKLSVLRTVARQAQEIIENVSHFNVYYDLRK